MMKLLQFPQKCFFRESPGRNRKRREEEHPRIIDKPKRRGGEKDVDFQLPQLAFLRKRPYMFVTYRWCRICPF